ncbi:MAG: acyloxyacyl hydrolase [Planctomycetota bacterium]
MNRPAAAVTSLACIAHVALAADTDGGRLSFARLYQPEETSGSTQDPIPSVRRAAMPAFGEKGHRRFQIQAGPAVGLEAEDAIDATLAFDISIFVAKDFEVAGEVGLWGFFQEGDDAAGISTSVVFRYHYINRDRWSAYLDAGIGPVFSTDNTPDGGTGVNFMPRLGVGLSYALGDSDARLVTGLRWHHISNARISGETGNPDRDGILVWAGISFPF